jgi:hypothetical protein
MYGFGVMYRDCCCLFTYALFKSAGGGDCDPIAGWILGRYEKPKKCCLSSLVIFLLFRGGRESLSDVSED